MIESDIGSPRYRSRVGRSEKQQKLLSLPHLAQECQVPLMSHPTQTTT
jgi:hypothetical protein